MSSKKKQTTNRQQFTAMVDVMKEEPDIAKGFSKKAPEVVTLFWDKFKTQLNSLGPPFKEVSEWKKVWSDYKSALRKKLAHEKQEKKATGGGPNLEIFFTPLDEEVIQLVCLRDCVKGVPSASSFGVPVKRKLNSSENLDEVNVPESENDQNINNIVTSGKCDETKRIPKPIMLLEKQINLQEKLYDQLRAANISEALIQIGEQQKKTHRALNRLIDHQKKGNTIQQELVEETKRHNQSMEQYVFEKNQLKRRILQIELNKIGDSLDE